MRKKKQIAVWFNSDDLEEYEKVKTYCDIKSNFSHFVRNAYYEALNYIVREFNKAKRLIERQNGNTNNSSRKPDPGLEKE